jgi:predicted ATPase
MSPRPPPLLALNEPETSLHPDLLGPLGELIAQAAARSQLWITTHSEALARDVAKRTGGRALALEKVGGETGVRPAGEPS